MHRMTGRDGKVFQSSFLRWGRTLAYVLMCLAGALLLLSPHIGVVYGFIGTVMAWFLFIGGGLAALGAASLRWAGEFTGLPLLASAFMVFGIQTYRGAAEDALPIVAAANFSLLAAIAVMLVVRWRVVLGVFRLVDYMVKHHRPGGEVRS